MSSNDDFYRRFADTLRHLGGGRITVDEALANAPISLVEASRSQGMFGDTSGMDTREIMRRGQLSGTHEVRHTLRGSWQQQQLAAGAGEAGGYRYVPEGCPRPVSWDADTLKDQGVIIVE